MHYPYSWVIRLECNSQIASSGQKRNIPSGWVVEIKGLRAFGNAVIAGALRKDDEIMAMEMDGMRSWDNTFRLLREQLLGSNNEIDVAVGVILLHDGIFLVESRVVKVEDGGIREIEPGFR